MKLFKSIEELICSTLNDELTNYVVCVNPTMDGHIVLEDVAQQRYVFIDDEEAGFRIRATQFKVKKPLDTVDVLESLRMHRQLPSNNIGLGTVQEALTYHSSGRPVNPFIQIFFDQNKKKDYQIIAHRDHHQAGVILLIKESSDEFVLVNFIDTLF